jgi:hypothetical protein
VCVVRTKSNIIYFQAERPALSCKSKEIGTFRELNEGDGDQRTRWRSDAESVQGSRWWSTIQDA